MSRKPGSTGLRTGIQMAVYTSEAINLGGRVMGVKCCQAGGGLPACSLRPGSWSFNAIPRTRAISALVLPSALWPSTPRSSTASARTPTSRSLRACMSTRVVVIFSWAPTMGTNRTGGTVRRAQPVHPPNKQILATRMSQQPATRQVERMILQARVHGVLPLFLLRLIIGRIPVSSRQNAQGDTAHPGAGRPATSP